MKNLYILISGVLISIVSFSLIYFKIGLWYFPATIGILMCFDFFSSIKNKKETTINLLLYRPIKFLKLYFLMFLLGSTIELFGRFIFPLWHYPYQTNIILDIVGLLFYPIILLSFREMYESLNIIIKNKFILSILAILLGIIIWEIPNLFIHSWIYTIPYIKLDILQINIVVIIGWSVLIGFPVWIYNEFISEK